MSKSTLSGYGRFLLVIAGLGGLLYGIDVGVIAAAIPYLTKTVDLTLRQFSVIVAAVFFGSMLGSPVAGALADWLGRKLMMVLSGLLFVASVGLIVISQGFWALFLGRLLQGLSGGVIAVVVPLYVAESLPADLRGRATALFQLLLTVGIALAALIGFVYTSRAEHLILLANNHADVIRAAQNHAWRGMFLLVIYPGVAFLLGSFALSESPRWLLRRGRTAEAAAALRRLGQGEQADAELRAITEDLPDTPAAKAVETAPAGSLLQRRYVYPFVLACVILACNQTTGINSILSYLVVILRQAGLSATHATQGDAAVKLLNCLMTVVAIALVDRKGRKFLLKLGTAGIVVSLAVAAFAFFSFESHRTDAKSQVQAAVRGNAVHQPIQSPQDASSPVSAASQPALLTVLYSYGEGTHMASAASGEPLEIVPEAAHPDAPLHIEKAFLTPSGSSASGVLIAACLALFIACYAVGPGVVVWLALSELMPMRIRSTGMGIALLLNQGVSTVIAAVFLPSVGSHGYYSMFFFWAACTVVYFIAATFFLPETKGRTLEEIELSFR